MYDGELAAPPGVRAALGMDAARIGGGVALSVRDDPARYWSKALGFGFEEPVTADLIGEVCAFYRSRGTPLAVLQLAPSVLPEDWSEICARENLSAGSAWVKLACPTDEALARAEEPGRPAAGVRVAPVEARDAAEWGALMMRGFGMPEEHLGAMIAGGVGRAGWHPYGAWLDGELVGTATMHVHGDAAQFFGAATLPHARRRGAQSAFLAARARAAAAAGCGWLVAETGAEAPGEHNSSLHNMRRAGFEVLYERRNWVWQPA